MDNNFVGSRIDQILQSITLPNSGFVGIAAESLDDKRSIHVGRSNRFEPRVEIVLAGENSQIEDFAAGVLRVSVHNRVDLATLGGQTVDIGACMIVSVPQQFEREFALMANDLVCQFMVSDDLVQIMSLIRSWASALQEQEMISESRVTGLWGELLLISIANDTAAFVEAWHSEPNSTYDFMFGEGKYLEVKTTKRPFRVHTFSMGQALSLPPSDLLVASLMIREGSNGTSVNDLRREILVNLTDPKDRLVFLNKFNQECNPAAPELNTFQFDATVATRLIKFYLGAELPCPVCKYPIVDVSWSVNFESLLNVSPSQNALLSRYFSA